MSNTDKREMWGKDRLIKGELNSNNKGNKVVISKGPHKGKANGNMNRNQPRFKFTNESKTTEE